MTAERDALRDLLDGLGWEFLERHVRADLAARRDRVLADSRDLAPFDAGIAMREYAAIERAVTALLAWPREQVKRLDAVESRATMGRRPH